MSAIDILRLRALALGMLLTFEATIPVVGGTSSSTPSFNIGSVVAAHEKGACDQAITNALVTYLRQTIHNGAKFAITGGGDVTVSAKGEDTSLASIRNGLRAAFKNPGQNCLTSIGNNSSRWIGPILLQRDISQDQDLDGFENQTPLQAFLNSGEVVFTPASGKQYESSVHVVLSPASQSLHSEQLRLSQAESPTHTNRPPTSASNTERPTVKAVSTPESMARPRRNPWSISLPSVDVWFEIALAALSIVIISVCIIALISWRRKRKVASGVPQGQDRSTTTRADEQHENKVDNFMLAQIRSAAAEAAVKLARKNSEEIEFLGTQIAQLRKEMEFIKGRIDMASDFRRTRSPAPQYGSRDALIERQPPPTVRQIIGSDTSRNDGLGRSVQYDELNWEKDQLAIYADAVRMNDSQAFNEKSIPLPQLGIPFETRWMGILPDKFRAMLCPDHTQIRPTYLLAPDVHVFRGISNTRASVENVLGIELFEGQPDDHVEQLQLLQLPRLVIANGQGSEVRRGVVRFRSY